MVEKNYPKKRFLLHQQEDKIRFCCLFLQKKHSRNLQKIKITKYFRRRLEVKSFFFGRDLVRILAFVSFNAINKRAGIYRKFHGFLMKPVPETGN